MMFLWNVTKINALRSVAYAIAFVSLGFLWYFFDDAFDVLYVAARGKSDMIAGYVAELLKIDEGRVQPVFEHYVDVTRAIIFFPIAFTLFVILLITFRQELGQNAGRFLFLYIAAHIILVLCWLVFFKATGNWYRINEEWAAKLFRASGNSRAITPGVRMAGLYRFFVTLELMLTLSIALAIVSGTASFLRRHYAGVMIVIMVIVLIMVGLALMPNGLR